MKILVVDDEDEVPLFPGSESYADVKEPEIELPALKEETQEMTIDDFIMENYNPIKPQLKLELGI